MEKNQAWVDLHARLLVANENILFAIRLAQDAIGMANKLVEEIESIKGELNGVEKTDPRS